MTAQRTAAAIRGHLGTTYPATPMTVTQGEKGNRGYLTISWTDGPAEDAILTACAPFLRTQTGPTTERAWGRGTARQFTPAALASIDTTTRDARALADEHLMDEVDVRHALARATAF